MANVKIFLSTDGKHTVEVDVEGASTTSMNLAYEEASRIYDEIVSKYGTKQEQTVKAYAGKPSFPNDSGKTAVAPEKSYEGLGNCSKCGAPNKISKAGKKYCSALCWQKG